MNKETPILDHGYVKYIEHYGSDERIIEAARMSTNKGFQGWGPKHAKDCKSGSYEMATGNYVNPLNCGCETQSGDEKLLAYLYSHKHATPFEMAGLIIEVQAPIFVFREWHRHRTQSYNEMSARYTPLPDLNYLPTMDRLMQQGGQNKQAQGLKTLTVDSARDARTAMLSMYGECEAAYQSMLNAGVPKELARLVIPVARYSRMRANANLRNWLAFLTLRMDTHAQWEIRQYANAVGEIISQLFPRTWALFMLDRKEQN